MEHPAGSGDRDNNIVWPPSNPDGSAASPSSRGARDRATLNFMGLASLGLDISILCDLLYSVLLFGTRFWGEISSSLPVIVWR